MRRLARISVWVLAFVVFVVVAQWSSLVAMLGFYAGVAAVTAVCTRRWDRRRRERARLLADARLQHWALCHGDVLTGVFGRHRPADMNPLPQEDAESDFFDSFDWGAVHWCPPWLLIIEDSSGLVETRVPGQPPPPPIDWETETVRIL